MLGDGKGHLEAGFVASRKVGGAVARNRARRRLKELLRNCLRFVPREVRRLVFVAGRSTCTASFERMKEALLSVLHDVDVGRNA